MTACIILAAGMGSRLSPLTDDRPKGLVPLLGKPLLVHQMEILKAAAVDPVAIVTGYRADKIEKLGCPTFHNKLYNSTNMVESLFAARAFMEKSQEDLLISYGDIVYQNNNLERVLNTAGDIAVMVDDGWLDLWSLRNDDPINDAETLKLDSSGRILELGKKPKSLASIEGQYTGLLKVSASRIADFIKFYDRLDRDLLYDGRAFEQMYMTSFLQLLIDASWDIKAAKVNHGWLEVDTVDDLRLYERLYQDGQLDALWRMDA